MLAGDIAIFVKVYLRTLLRGIAIAGAFFQSYRRGSAVLPSFLCSIIWIKIVAALRQLIS
jgi:hypothetical protein